MKQLLSILFILFAFALPGRAQSFGTYKVQDLKNRMESNADTIYVINFWATWCAPCVKELPEFNKIQDYFKGKAVKVLLVSLDFKDNYKKRIPFFIDKKNIQPEVVWFNETNANSFIPRIDKRWTGSIPATLIYKKGLKMQYLLEQEITAQQVIDIVEAVALLEE